MVDYVWDDESVSPAPAFAPALGDNEFAVATIEFALRFEAARLAGLALLDSTALPGTEYRYSVTLEDGTVLGPLDLSTAEYTTYPAPVGLVADWYDGLVDLRWYRAATEAAYVAYDVERARLTEEGVPTDWEAVNSSPLVHLHNPDAPADSTYLTDTAAARDFDHAYRVVGHTPFGHTGPVSDTIVVRADPLPLFDPPRIARMERVVDTLFRVSWQLPAGVDAADVAGFRVYTSREPDVDLADVSGALGPEAREHVLVDPDDGLFVVVEAVDRNGTPIASDPRVLRALDRRPPAPPTGLRGSVDTSGVVTLAWDAGPEDDLAGYRVFTANRPDGYFPQLTPRATLTPAWTDTITMATRAEEVYYKVLAVDYAGNYSDFSATLELSRPDLQPPVAPLLREVRADTAAVYLEAAYSSSDDVVEHRLQRRLAGGRDTTWRTVATPRPASREVAVVRLADSAAVPGRTYDYRLVAEDDAGYRTASRTRQATRIDDGRRAPVRGFSARVIAGTDFPTLSWAYPDARGVAGFRVYRADGPDAEPEAHAYLTAGSPGLRLRGDRYYYADRTAAAGRTYTYKLFAQHEGGGFSAMTAPATVTLPAE